MLTRILCNGFMMTSSNGRIFRVTGHFAGNSPGTGEFPAQRPVTRSFDVFFDLRLNKRLNKQWWGWCFGTPSSPLGSHSNVMDVWTSWHERTPHIIGPLWWESAGHGSPSKGQYFGASMFPLLLAWTSCRTNSPVRHDTYDITVMSWKQRAVRCRYDMVNFLRNSHNRYPVRARYGVSVVILKSDSLSATVMAAPHVISW